jgi:hypothetical protein
VGLLDWIKSSRNRSAAHVKTTEEPLLNPREHGHASMRDLASEVRGDEALAKLRNETGREPESGPKMPGRVRGRGMER